MAVNELHKEQMMNDLATTLNKVIKGLYGKEMGWFLSIFQFGDVEYADYISNAEREDMITALRETATRLENKEDIAPIIGTA